RNRRGSKPGQPEEVRPAVVAEAERDAECLEDLRGRGSFASLLEPYVVVGADPGQRGDLLPAKTGHAAGAGHRQVRLGRRDTGATAAEVVPESGAGHEATVAAAAPSVLGVLVP